MRALHGTLIAHKISLKQEPLEQIRGGNNIGKTTKSPRYFNHTQEQTKLLEQISASTHPQQVANGRRYVAAGSDILDETEEAMFLSNLKNPDLRQEYGKALVQGLSNQVLVEVLTLEHLDGLTAEEKNFLIQNLDHKQVEHK